MNSEDQENIAPLPEEPTSEDLFNVEILSFIKLARQQHGLRHNHYQRYGEYCSRRLKRLRKVLNFKAGDKRKVHPKKITENVFSDPRFIMLLVMSCERSWTTAMEFKEDEESNPRKRHHKIERLRKAMKTSIELVELCENSTKVSACTKLESQAYSAYISGVLLFEQQDWVKARDCFQKTSTIYDKLSETLPKAEKAIYKEMVDEVSPNLRYCAYQIGDDQTAKDELVHMHGTASRQDPLLANKLDSLIAESRERQASTMSEVMWGKRPIRLKNNKVRLFLIGAKDFEANMSQTDETDLDGKIELYDNYLSECKDAIQVTREDIKNDPHSKTAELSDLQLLHSYLNHLRLTKMIQRNLLSVEILKSRAPELRLDEVGDSINITNNQQNNPNTGGGSSGKKQVKPVDFIRLYDSMLQNLTDLANLPGMMDDNEAAERRSEIDMQQLAFRAYRCFYAAQSKANDKSWKEANALYDRVLVHAGAAIQAFQLFTPMENTSVDIDGLQKLVETITFNKYRVHAAAVLTNMGGTDDVAFTDQDRKKPIMDRLDQYDEPSTPGTLTEAFPPVFRPVPGKPRFFDLAASHVGFPSLEGKLKPSAQQKAGISGWLSGWWGGK